MDVVQWLSIIQGKQVSKDIMNRVKQEVETMHVSSNKSLYESIQKAIELLQYPDDNSHTLARYVYEHMLGYHIDALDLKTENFVLEEFGKVRVEGHAINKVPFIYILQCISNKHGLNIKKTITFPEEKQKYFNLLLKFYIE